MTYRNVGMSYALNCGINASFEAIEADIQRILNGAPEPYIDINCPYPSMIQHESPEYKEEYGALLEYRSKHFGNSRSRDVDSYGFSHWKSNHPLINDITMMYEQYHWRHMQKYVEKIERELRISEIERGVKYSTADRVSLVSERAKQLRDEDVAWQEPYWRNALAEAMTRPMREFFEDRTARLQQPVAARRASVIDAAVDFQQQHPFLAGLIGANIYHRIKDALSR